jgi:hypothetical protein
MRFASRSRIAIFFTLAILVVLTGLALAAGRVPVVDLILAELMRRDQAVRMGLLRLDPAEMARILQLNALAFAVAAVLAAALWRVRHRLLDTQVRQSVFSLLVLLACSSTLFILLARTGYEAEWYKLERLMTDPTSVPIFGQRLLFVWLANLIQGLTPSLSHLRAFYATQLLIIVFTIWIIGRWSATVAGPPTRFIGQGLLVLMLAPTLRYHTFYDIGIVFFYTACLLLLYSGRYLWFVVALGVATLNHENSLLLIPLSAYLLYDDEPRRIWIGIPVLALGVYVVVRLGMQWALPTDTQFHLRIWTNLANPYTATRLVVESAAILVPWWAAGLCGFPAAGTFIRRATALLPLLILVTWFFGQFHEPRQFDAFIPVAIALILVVLREHAPPLAVDSKA